MVNDAHDVFLTREVYARCQEIYQRRSIEYKQYHIPIKHGLLSDALYCAECSQRLHVKTNKGKGYTYYYYKHRPRKEGKDVHVKCKTSHNLKSLDTKIIETVKAIGSSPEAAQRFIACRNDEQESKALHDRLAGLEQALKALIEKNKKLLALYLDGVWDKATLDEKKKSLEAQIRLNEKQQQEVRQRLTFLTSEEGDFDLILEYFAALAQFDTEMIQEQQLTLVRAMFTRTEVDKKGNLTLACRIPLPEEGTKKDHNALMANGLDRFQSHPNIRASDREQANLQQVGCFPGKQIMPANFWLMATHRDGTSKGWTSNQ